MKLSEQLKGQYSRARKVLSMRDVGKEDNGDSQRPHFHVPANLGKNLDATIDLTQLNYERRSRLGDSDIGITTPLSFHSTIATPRSTITGQYN